VIHDVHKFICTTISYFHKNFHLSNISTGEGHAWRWAPNKTPNT